MLPWGRPSAVIARAKSATSKLAKSAIRNMSRGTQAGDQWEETTLMYSQVTPAHGHMY